MLRVYGARVGRGERVSRVQELFEKILAEYPQARTGSTRNSPMRGVFERAARALDESRPMQQRWAFIATRSIGQGVWADVPWISLLDSRETTTTTRGTYAAYLFRGDGSAVALCVMQGATEPLRRGAEGRAEIVRKIADIRDQSGPELEAAGFALDAVDLRPRTRLGRDYEFATAAFKLYERGTVPDDEALLNDLEVALAAVDRFHAAPVAAVYVGRPALTTLDASRRAGIWGWRTNAPELDAVVPGAALLFASGYSGGSPRRELDEWRRHRLDRIVVARVSSRLLNETASLSAAERDVVADYPVRVRYEVLEEHDDIELAGPRVSVQLVDAIRRSAISSSRPMVVWDSSAIVPLRSAEQAPASGSEDAGQAPVTPAPLGAVAAALRSAIDDSGLYVRTGDGDGIHALVAALATKPFVILTGLPGSGKTQQALRLGEWFGTGRHLVVPVRPDWTGPEALLGYQDGLERPDPRLGPLWAVPATLEFILRAQREPAKPYLLVLDEMNLAHVERYFSDFLSGLESRQPVIPDLVNGAKGWRSRTGGQAGLLPLPSNLFVIGTVNVDETTYLFSPKVLDRAVTFELRTATEELELASGKPAPLSEAEPELLAGLLVVARDDDWHLAPRTSVVREAVATRLLALHRTLALSGDEFGHRLYRESLRLAVMLHETGGADADRALDHIVLLKLLPRIHGARTRVEPVLLRLLAFAQDPSDDFNPPEPDTVDLDVPATLGLSAVKLRRMIAAVRVNQFVSFTE